MRDHAMDHLYKSGRVCECVAYVMLKRMKWILAIIATGVFASCGNSDSAVELVTDYEKCLTAYQELVLGVKDEKSALAASAQLKTMGDDLERLAGKLAEADPPTEEEMPDLKKNLIKLIRMNARLTEEVTGRWLDDPKVMQIMGEALVDYGNQVKLVESSLLHLKIDPNQM